jgi:hypothetical protein
MSFSGSTQAVPISPDMARDLKLLQNWETQPSG